MILKTSTFFKASLIAAALNSSTVMAQAPDYNRWSIEGSFGVNKPFAKSTPGYFTDPINMFSAGLGTRFMANEKFGIMLDLGYDQFKNSSESSEFSSVYVRTSLQGVINMGKILEFNTWTHSLGLLVHGGGGISSLNKELQFGNGAEGSLNLIAGITPQVKLAERVSIFADLSAVGTVLKEKAFDFQSNVSDPGVDGIIIQGKIGISVYLGKKAQHADWHISVDPLKKVVDSLQQSMLVQQERINTLEGRVNNIETDLQDSDNDGVADKFDQEPGTPAGATVNTKGQEVKEVVRGNASLDPMKGLFFTVQLGVYSQPVPAEAMKNITPLETKTMPDGKIRYFSGIFNSQEEAAVKLAEAKKAGISDAFMTAYYKGDRITLAEARTFLSELGPEILEKK